MIENPARSASEEAAKELAKNYKNGVFDYLRAEEIEVSATIIKRYFTPVVAAAAEAMKEKCADECDCAQRDRWEAGLSAQETLKWNSWVTQLGDAIRAIPTGTALAEYVERATAPLIAELSRMKSGRPPEHGPLTEDEVEHRVERATAELRAEIVKRTILENGQLNEIAELTRKGESLCCQNGSLIMENHDLKAQLAEAEPIIQTYARENPKWWNPTAEKGMTQSVPQDPMGAHAWLEKHAALSAPAKEGEKP